LLAAVAATAIVVATSARANVVGITFTEFSTPDVMMGGGRQAMVVHS
jgi:hypothetical protein